MKDSFFIAIRGYLHNISNGAWNLWFPLIMLGSFVLLTLIIALIYTRKQDENEEKPRTTTFKILASMYLAGGITLFGTLIAVIWLLKFTPFFGVTFAQFGIIVGFLLMSILTFVAYRKICIKTKKNEKSVLNVSISRSFLSEKVRSLKSILKTLLLTFLLMATPFLLLLVKNKQQNLVSIVLDNSGSMMNYLHFGINSLETVLAQSPHNIHYVFTTLTPSRNIPINDTTVEQYFNTIVNTTNPNNLPTTTEIFTSSRDLINSFSNVEPTNASPIFQGVWQNFLEARNFTTMFTSKKMIIITDGEDNLYHILENDRNQRWSKRNIFQETGMVGQNIEEFFNEIHIINLGENEHNYMYADCFGSFIMHDGINQQSYFNALVDILPEMYFDWILLYIIMGLLIILFFSLFIVRTLVR